MARACFLTVLAVSLLMAPPPARAQPVVRGDREAPVYYQADRAEYDRESGVATLTGRVEIWQNDRLLLADKVSFNRNSNVAAAIGNVVLLEPDGQTLFSDYAELGDGLRDGVLSGVRALLAQQGRLAANGARRTDGKINELSRAVYSTCDLCPDDPSRAPLWQIRARTAVQDRDNKRIEYQDAVLDLFGVPMFYLPYLTHPDPTEKRASGLLVPSVGYSRRLGVYAVVPYYWAIDGSSDATISPLLGSNNGPAIDLEYRRWFNTGSLTIDSSMANARGILGGHIFARGAFAIDETWRWGFDVNRATSARYMRDFRVQNWQAVLTSQVYVEGFGQGAYTRLDGRLYQGLTTSIIARRLPFVLPHYQYSFAGERDRLGGRIGFDVDFFNLLRQQGTNLQRGRVSVGWERPMMGRVGDVWNVALRVDSTAYIAQQFDQQPNFGLTQRTNSSQAMPTMALHWRWPLLRRAGEYGTQTIEPIAQIAYGARGSTYLRTRIPNEDSLDLEFTDANLFALNRFAGVDRLEGGLRGAAALRAAWQFPAGGRIEALVGQSFRDRRDRAFPAGSGLDGTASDIVSRVTIAPTSWLDITSRQRFSRRGLTPQLVDTLATVGDERLRVFGGYLYSRTNPYLLYETAASVSTPTSPRNEVMLGAAASWDSWRLSGWVRRDLRTGQMVGEGLRAGYEDECFIFDVSFYRRHTSINGDHGASTLLFQVTFKTVGQFGFNAK